MPTRTRRAAQVDTSPHGGGGGRRVYEGWWIVASLAVTQTVGYGVLSYSFAVFLTPMRAELHASSPAVTGALTCSLLAWAAAAIPVGRWLDHHGGRGLMAGGSVAAVLLVLAWSRVHSLAALYAVWIGIGLCSAAVLYEAAFAVVVTFFTGPMRHRRSTAVLAITVVAGFASSIFLPLSGLLADRYGWRHAVVVLAVILALVTIPGHLMLRRPPALDRTDGTTAAPASRRAVIGSALHDRAYWLLGLAFIAQAAAVSVLAVHLVAYLRERGHPAGFAATVAGLLGVLSVTGRLATTAAQKRRRPATVTAAVFVVQAAGVAAMPLLAGTTAGAVGCVLAFGLGFGVATIARPTLLADRYGTTGFATLSGLLATPLTLARALAPLAAAALREATGSYTPVLYGCAAACLLAAAALRVADRTPSVEAER